MAGPASAQEVIDLQLTERFDPAEVAASKAEIFDRLVERIAFENIQTFIGKEKTERNKENIKNKVVKNFNRFILSSKSSPITKVPGTNLQEVKVDIKLSLKNLRSLLLEEGLLYQTEGPPKLLPAVRFIDRVGAVSYNWWADKPTRESTYLVSAFKSFQGSLKSELMKIGFYSMNPSEGNFGESVPEAYKLQAPQTPDLLFLGELFKSSIVLKGDIIFRGKPNQEGVYLIDFRIQALQTQNGRMLAEVVRVYETPVGEFKAGVAKKFNEVVDKVSEDLATQMNDAWKKGTFGASLLRLVVKSDLPPKDLEDFKKVVVLQVREVKALRERVMANRSLTFEMDSSAPPQQVAQAIRIAKFNQFKVQVQDVDTNSVTLQVSK